MQTGTSKLSTPNLTAWSLEKGLPRHERGTRATKSDSRAIRIASGECGHNDDDRTFQPERPQDVVDRLGKILSPLHHDVVAGRIAFGRHPGACQKRMPNPSHADIVVAEKQLGPNLRRRPSQYADLQIDQSLPQRIGAFIRLGREAETDAWRGFGDGRHQGS